MTHTASGPISFERMIGVVQDVRDRLDRGKTALENARLEYALVGGLAVAAWVETADEGGIRNTPNVDIMIRQADLSPAQSALEKAGFVHQLTDQWHRFLDCPNSRPRSAVKVLFSETTMKPDELEATPSVAESVRIESNELGNINVIALEPLVLMKLTAHRTIDRVHIRDMIDVQLIDAAWPARFQPALAERLQALLDDPDG